MRFSKVIIQSRIWSKELQFGAREGFLVVLVGGDQNGGLELWRLELELEGQGRKRPRALEEKLGDKGGRGEE